MRAIILGLSVLCYAFAVFITTAAWLVPKTKSAPMVVQPPVEMPPEVTPEEEIIPAPDSMATGTTETVPPPDAGPSEPEASKPQEAETIVEEETISPSETREGVVVAVLGDGLFEPGRHLLTPELKAAVSEILPILATHPSSRIVVEGHTDNIPLGANSRYASNRELSLLRAGSVAELLEDRGISRERLSIYGYGSSRPVSSNETPIGRAQNRRVEIRLIPPISPR